MAHTNPRSRRAPVVNSERLLDEIIHTLRLRIGISLYEFGRIDRVPSGVEPIGAAEGIEFLVDRMKRAVFFFHRSIQTSESVHRIAGVGMHEDDAVGLVSRLEAG